MWLKVQPLPCVSFTAVLLGHQEQRDLSAKIEELSPERTWPSVSDGSTPNFHITSYLKPTLGEGKIKYLLLKSEL